MYLRLSSAVLAGISQLAFAVPQYPAASAILLFNDLVFQIINYHFYNKKKKEITLISRVPIERITTIRLSAITVTACFV